MLEIKTTRGNYMCCLALIGHAFENNSPDVYRSHGFYWAMRWLARQILGENWLLWNSQVGEDQVTGKEKYA